MYNSQQYNTQLYNGDFNLNVEVLSTDKVSFGGYSLMANGICVTNLYYESINRDFNTSDRPSSHGQNVNSDYWRKKVIRVEGHITADTEEELEDLIFEFKKEMSKKEQYLDIITANEERRRFRSTVTSNSMVDRGKNYEINFTTFSLNFECSEPFGESYNKQYIIKMK